MKILHISHSDLDGVTPLHLTRLVYDLVKTEYPENDTEVYYQPIFSARMLGEQLDRIFNHVTGPDALENPTSFDKSSVIYDLHYDKIIITDLNITEEIFVKILDYGLEHFYIADHHVTSFDPVKYIMNHEVYSVKYKDWSIATIQRHCRISSYLINLAQRKEIQTCGTQIYLYDVLLPTLKEEFPDAYKIAEPILQHSNMYFYIEAVRLWDTFGWKELSESSSNRVSACRLNTIFQLFRADGVEKYMRDYLLTDTSWMTLGYSITQGELRGGIKLDNYTPYYRSLYMSSFVNDEMDRKKKVLKDLESSYQTMSFKFKIKKETGIEEKEYIVGLFLADQPGMASECCHHILEVDESVEIAVAVGPHSISLRSRSEDDIDVSEIARSYGGGGHKHASGITCQPNDMLWMQRNYFTGLMNLASTVVGTAE